MRTRRPAFASHARTGGFEDPLSKASAVYKILIGFLMLVLVSSYTANLAAYMASTKVQLAPSSLAEFMEPGSAHKACVLANSAYAAFLGASAKYGAIAQVPVRSLFAMADALKAGECQGIIERRMHVRYLESLGGSEGYPVQVRLVGQQLHVCVCVHIYMHTHTHM